MKRITLLFIAIIACLVTVAAQSDTIETKQLMTDTQIEYTDTPAQHANNGKYKPDHHDSFLSDFNLGVETIIPLVAIISVFGLPVLIVFIAFYFKYKNKKAKYKLAEQALAAGQPIPEEFFKQKTDSILQKGITNTFTGIGLFIFLWAITGEFSIGCIGLLIMFMGLGQIVIHYTHDKKEDKRNTGSKDHNISIEE